LVVGPKGVSHGDRFIPREKPGVGIVPRGWIEGHKRCGSEELFYLMKKRKSVTVADEHLVGFVPKLV
jgi:hypothetical protein